MKMSFNKRTGQVICLAGVLLIAQYAGAASFDCAKASTKVEHIICDNPEISKLDEELAQSYKAALQNQADAKRTKQAQRQWVKERDDCADVGCVKRAYEARLATLTKSVVENAQQDTSTLTEKTKGEIVSKILNNSEITLKPGIHEKDREFVNFCNTFIADFKQQRGTEYIEPVFRTDDYNHPVFVKLRNQCPKFYWPEPEKCNAAYLATKLRGLDEEASDRKAREICETQFGTTEYALYEIDFGDHKENVIYSLRTPRLYRDELLALLDTSNRSDDPRYDDIRPLTDNFFQNGEYNAYNFSTCGTPAISSLATVVYALPETYLGFIKYGTGYFAYHFQRLNRQNEVYRFVLGGGRRNATCAYEAAKPESSKRGNK